MDTEEIQLDREDVVLLLLEANERLLRKETLNGITRLEKLLFLLERESTFEGVGDFFVFEPYSFGPFSKEVYEATEFLDGCELIEINEKTYASTFSASGENKLMDGISDCGEHSGVDATEKCFALTQKGRKVARIMQVAVGRRRPSDPKEVDRIVRRYGTLPLNRLIRYVYHQYPDMTSKSIHPEAERVQRSL